MEKVTCCALGRGSQASLWSCLAVVSHHGPALPPAALSKYCPAVPLLDQRPPVAASLHFPNQNTGSFFVAYGYTIQAGLYTMSAWEIFSFY
jgi:hypothetical protein